MEDRKTNANDWRTILSLGLSGLGIAYFLIQALSFSFLWLSNFNSALGSMDQAISFGLLIWSSILSGLMLVPVFLLSLSELRGQAPPGWLANRHITYRKSVLWIVSLWPVIVLIGWLIADRPMMAAFLLGPINILVAGLPILWVYTSAGRGLKRGLQVRQWRIFGFSLTITPLIVIFLEIMAIAILGGMGALWFYYRTSVDPTLERDLMYLINQVSIYQHDVDALIEILQPYILQPGVIVWVFVLFAGLIPIIEELIKTIALWPMAGCKITPQEGFVGGLLCGAGFALMENVLYFTVSITAMDWLFMAIGRAGTGVLHMLASGLIGWGLAVAWRSGKWRFLSGTTFFAILLHGLWNAVALVTGIASLVMLETESTAWQNLLYSLPTIILFIISMIGIGLINRHFRQQNHLETTLTDQDSKNGERVVY
ncbi:MAG: PrsW family glutamic-type intramembrane protease [Chloroflexota bacterium]|nr:PrsW family glutamic-type intramembrane protease [Chloroflexota bacterium]